MLAAASLYGWRTGVFTGVVSSLAYNFFFLPPIYTFTIQDPENVLTVVVFIAVAIVTSQLAARVRVQANLAERSSGQNAALASFARMLAGLTTRQELGQTLCGEVSAQFDVDAVSDAPEAMTSSELTAAVPPESQPRSDRHRRRRMGDRAQGADGPRLQHAGGLGMAFPAVAREWPRALGFSAVARKDGSEPIRPDRLPFLMSFIDQAALALERIALREEMTTVAQLRERDRLRGALLSSVSHDLRTPLTTIIAAVNELKKSKSVRSPHCCTRLRTRASGSAVSSATCSTWSGSRRAACS